MSMLLAQIDELRNAARGQKAMGLFELAQMLKDAADTIWQLRDDLQRTNAENAKLRELLAIASDMARDYDGDRRLLRELVHDYHRFADAMCAERDCDGCSQRDDGACERGVLTSRECVLGVAE